MSKIITKATTRSFTNPERTTDWTQAITRLPNRYSFIKGLGMFQTRGTPELSVTFDEIFTKRLIHGQTKRGGKPRAGSDRRSKTHSIVLPHWKDMDTVTGRDVQSFRMEGTADMTKPLAMAINEKMADLRGTVDQLHEFLMFSALTGTTIDPDGVEIFNAFDEFGVTQDTQDFAFSTSSLVVNNAFTTLVNTIAQNKSTASGGVDIFASFSWFQALLANDNYRENYLYQQAPVSNPLRDANFTIYDFGVVGMLELMGGAIRVYAYNPEFMVEAEDGTISTRQLITEGEAIAVPRNSTEMFRGWYGPRDTLSGANAAGVEVFANVYRDPRDQFVEVGVETSPLFINTDPAATILLTNS